MSKYISLIKRGFKKIDEFLDKALNPYHELAKDHEKILEKIESLERKINKAYLR